MKTRDTFIMVPLSASLVVSQRITDANAVYQILIRKQDEFWTLFMYRHCLRLIEMFAKACCQR